MNHATILSTEIHQLDGLYSLSDLHKASGGAAKHKPTFFLRTGQTQALVTEITRVADMQLTPGCSDMSNPPVKVVRGFNKQQGTYVCRELVVAYAAWISPAFYLQVLRVFLDVKTDKPTPKTSMDSDPRFVAEVAQQVGADIAKAHLYITPQKIMDIFVLTYADALWHKKIRPAFTRQLIGLLK